MQDKQNRMRLDRVTHFGISCGDKIEGPFDLEIEYVGKFLYQFHINLNSSIIPALSEPRFQKHVYKRHRHIKTNKFDRST